MSVNFDHGPEIIERREGAGIIRDVKSAVTFIVGTAPIEYIYDTPEKRKNVINKRLVIRSQKEAVSLLGPQKAGYTLPEAISAIFNKVQDGQGGGTIIAVNVFDPDKHKNDDGKPDPSMVVASDIVGGFDEAGQASGFQLAYGTFNELGFFPKILLAPRFSTHIGVRTGMNVISNKIHAIDISDLPAGLTIQQAVA